jgi:hypothetical protein
MKTLLNLTAVLTLAFTANIASADIDYDDMLDDARDAYQHAAALQQIAANLPNGFPDKSQFQTKTTGMRNDLLQLRQHLQQIVNGQLAELTPQEVDQAANEIQFYRTSVVQWIENHAREIEQNQDGLFEDLAERMRREADEVDDSLRSIKNELD